MQPQWMDLTINNLNVKQNMFPDNLRAILAKQNDSADPNRSISREIFHYQENGFPNTSQFPPFRISANGRTGHIYAVGVDAVEYLQENGHKIMRMISSFNGQPAPEHRYTGTYSIHHIPYLRPYFIPRMVINNSRSKYLKIQNDLKNNVMTPAIAQMIEDKIRQGILDHATLMGCPIDEDFTLGDIAVERFTCIPAKGGKSTRFVTVAVGLTFRAGLRLEGVIHVGHMKAKGYGFIRRGSANRS
ncbi:MAG: hypothetical protein PHI97_00630 [Desulfobulbus sp.]|jgi:hypothetical protein|nr:hypothetical protein [Desulfobulbus sp.]